MNASAFAAALGVGLRRSQPSPLTASCYRRPHQHTSDSRPGPADHAHGHIMLWGYNPITVSVNMPSGRQRNTGHRQRAWAASGSTPTQRPRSLVPACSKHLLHRKLLQGGQKVHSARLAQLAAHQAGGGAGHRHTMVSRQEASGWERSQASVGQPAVRQAGRIWKHATAHKVLCCWGKCNWQADRQHCTRR